jgi:hypothetical protein
MQRMAAAFKNIKFPEGMVQLESIVARVLERDPVSWQAQLDAMDTIIFFLNYAGAERLELAYSQFRALNVNRPRVEEALATIEQVTCGRCRPIHGLGGFRRSAVCWG